MADELKTVYRDDALDVQILQRGSHLFVRTPNATITIEVTHDKARNDLTSLAMVGDAQDVIETGLAAAGSLFAYTRHSEQER